MHSRMRHRVTEFQKVLNRAKTEVATGERKTVRYDYCVFFSRRDDDDGSDFTVAERCNRDDKIESCNNLCSWQYMTGYLPESPGMQTGCSGPKESGMSWETGARTQSLAGARVEWLSPAPTASLTGYTSCSIACLRLPLQSPAFNSVGSQDCMGYPLIWRDEVSKRGQIFGADQAPPQWRNSWLKILVLSSSLKFLNSTPPTPLFLPPTIHSCPVTTIPESTILLVRYHRRRVARHHQC